MKSISLKSTYIKTSITAVALSIASTTWAAGPVVGQFLTGSSGGVYDILGGGLTNTINKHVDNMRLNPSNPATISRVPVQLNNGRAVLGIVQMDIINRAMKGIEEYQQPQPNVRVLMGLYDNVMSQVVLDDSPIQNINEAAGLKIGVPSEGTKMIVAGVYEMAGVPEDKIEWVYLSYAEIADALRDGYIDIGTLTAFPKNGTVEGLAATEGVRFLEADDSIQDQWNRETPINAFRKIPAGTYPGVDEDAAFYAVFASLIASTHLSDDAAYRIVKGVYENVDEVAAVHPAGKQISLAKTQEYIKEGIISPEQLHPGARKYLEEKGIELQ